EQYEVTVVVGDDGAATSIGDFPVAQLYEYVEAFYLNPLLCLVVLEDRTWALVRSKAFGEVMDSVGLWTCRVARAETSHSGRVLSRFGRFFRASRGYSLDTRKAPSLLLEECDALLFMLQNERVQMGDIGRVDL